MSFEPTMLQRVQGALDKSVGATSAPQKGELTAKPLMQGLVEQFGSFQKAQTVMNEIVIPRLKALGTVDIAALRLVSLSDRVVVKRNEETQFLNFLESKDSMPPILDYQYRIKERDILTDNATLVNIDSTSLPPFPTIQSAYNQRYNTLTTVGNTLKVSFMASAIAEQQSDVNILEEQIDDQIVRIRRTFNRILLSNTEQVAEAPGVVPQLGGFVTRSTLNTLNAGGSNLTNTLIQTATNTIGTQLGYAHQFMIWGTPGQEPVVRDLMINRFPGQNSEAFYQSLDRLRRMQMETYQVKTQTVYQAYPGGAMPFVYDTQMPANTALLFVGEFPRLARFKMDGQVGPFVLARPEQTLYELVAVFDICTLDDPLQVSRVQITNLAS